jgi:DNA-binding transcriptional MerR regulator
MKDVLGPWRNTELELPRLVEAVSAVLSCIAGQEIAPDERTVRYYQTLGLVDRPTRYEGRIARYGFRHLLQLLCIRLLQKEGFGLQQIQTALVGASDAALEAAVAEALGTAPPPPAARPLVSSELAPGIWLTIDPVLYPDSARIIQKLLSSLHNLETP